MIVDDSTVARAVLSRMIESDPAISRSPPSPGPPKTRSTRSASAASTSSCSTWKCPARAASKSHSADHRRRGRRQGHDRLLACRRRRRADRRRAGARRRRHAAQARHRPLQRPLFRNPARQAARRSAMRRAQPLAAATAQARRPPALLRAMPTDPIDVLAIGASTGGIHALGVLFQALPQAHRRADPRHAASADRRS